MTGLLSFKNVTRPSVQMKVAARILVTIKSRSKDAIKIVSSLEAFSDFK